MNKRKNQHKSVSEIKARLSGIFTDKERLFIEDRVSKLGQTKAIKGFVTDSLKLREERKSKPENEEKPGVLAISFEEPCEYRFCIDDLSAHCCLSKMNEPFTSERLKGRIISDPKVCILCEQMKRLRRIEEEVRDGKREVRKETMQRRDSVPPKVTMYQKQRKAEEDLRLKREENRKAMEEDALHRTRPYRPGYDRGA